ncbi:hypothetical protein CRUP_034352 [Coryphaenoides rupestris]|nr:hypothetical protein CRUP_034352 [Coryphaenoides rupestris]
MSSLGNGRFDIPDYDQLEDESFPPLPPPHSPGQGGDLQDPFGEEDGDVSKLPDVPAPKRRIVKKPQPKLDSQRLTSERGLPALRTLFDNAHFKGKGHEAEDLRVVMQKMENWAHRLYPKLQFNDFIDKVERLGSKKDVQTCLKRIRLDMPLIHDDFISKDGENEMIPAQHVFEDPDPFSSSGGFPGDSQGPVHSTPAPVHSTPAPVHSTPAPPTLTEEQRRRIELNKQLALERRLARMRQHTDLPDSQAVSSQAADPQAVDPQAVSSQASPVHQPSVSSPPGSSESCPPEPGLEETEDMDLDVVDPSTEHDQAKDSAVSVASPKHEEGEPSQPES